MILPSLAYFSVTYDATRKYFRNRNGGYRTNNVCYTFGKHKQVEHVILNLNPGTSQRESPNEEAKTRVDPDFSLTDTYLKS